MALGDALARRLDELRKQAAKVTHNLDRIQEGATIAAVNKAQQATPPNGGAPLAGTNARSGQLAQAWVTDSKTKPIKGVTVLANNQQYASYVNDGHRMDKHFVPGLHEVGGMLAYDANYDGGIVVGTKTQFVEGLYMKEQATDEYIRVCEFELNKILREAGFK